MRRVIVDKVLPWVVFALFVIAAIVPWILTAVYAPRYTFFRVPIASWFVLGLSGALLALDVAALCLWRWFRAARRELVDLKKPPLEVEIPIVYGHKNLDRAEFLAIIQALFGRSSGAGYLHTTPLPGGYGGSTTVLVELRREQEDGSTSRSYVVKLGDRREMADEHEKFHRHVLGQLKHAARFYRYTEWESLAGIAYEFVGLGRGHQVQSFYQFYQGHTAVEVAEMVGEVYAHLNRAWYWMGRKETEDLYGEYRLLSKKQRHIISHVGEIVDEDDPYRFNFAGVQGRLRPNLKPTFCPELDMPWHDPIAFLRTWPRPNLNVPVYRSIVHGDLHAQNVLVEAGPHGQREAWFIDFSHTGNGLSGDRTREALGGGVPIDPDRGHTLRDFCRLEADVKFILTRLESEDDLRLALAFERELMAGGLALCDLPATPPPTEALTQERFRKAWLVIREIRRRAADYLIGPDDLRPYYLSLLHATLPLVYYHQDQFENETCERQQKRYALLAAGMLCSQL